MQSLDEWHHVLLCTVLTLELLLLITLLPAQVTGRNKQAQTAGKDVQGAGRLCGGYHCDRVLGWSLVWLGHFSVVSLLRIKHRHVRLTGEVWTCGSVTPRLSVSACLQCNCMCCLDRWTSGDNWSFCKSWCGDISDNHPSSHSHLWPV